MISFCCPGAYVLRLREMVFLFDNRENFKEKTLYIEVRRFDEILKLLNNSDSLIHSFIYMSRSFS